MTGVTLDIVAVRAFVQVADLRSFTRAAIVLGSTQSAVSVRIKRLEESLGHRLLERTPRHVGLSLEGARFIDAARALVVAHHDALSAFDRQERRLSLGISHHLVGTDLPTILRRVGDAEPGLVLDLRIASSRDILRDFDHGAIDAGIVFRHDTERRDGETIMTERLGWFAAPDFARPNGTPLRLALQDEPCSIRTLAVEALDASGISWVAAFVGGGVVTTGAAAAAGLAVAVLGRRVAPPGTLDVSETFQLPALPARDIVLHARAADQGTRRALGRVIEAIRAT